MPGMMNMAWKSEDNGPYRSKLGKASKQTKPQMIPMSIAFIVGILSQANVTRYGECSPKHLFYYRTPTARTDGEHCSSDT